MTLKKRLLKYLFLPVLLQFAVLFISVLSFVMWIGRNNGARMIMPQMIVDGEITDPNLVRFVFLLFAPAISAALAIISSMIWKKRGEKAVIPCFWTALIAGLMLWQSLGECLWHFGLPFDSSKVQASMHRSRYMMFPHLESGSCWPIFIPVVILALYCARSDALRFPASVLMLTFMSNWFGHIILIGSYPFVSAIMNEVKWFRLSCGFFAAPVIIFALHKAVKKDTGKQDTLLSSIMLYAGLGIIAMGLRGG